MGLKLQLYSRPSEPVGVKCPRCDAHAAVVASKPYCPACGWNREGVEQELRAGTSLTPLVIVIGFAGVLGVSAVKFSGRGNDALFVGGALFLFLIAIFLGAAIYRARRTLEEFLASNPVAPARSVSFDEDASASAKCPASPAWELAEQIRQMPVPRRVRFRWSNPAVWFVLAIVAVILLMVAIAPQGKSRGARGARSGDIGFGVAAALVLPVAAVFLYRIFATEKNLLENGTLAEARVVRQEWRKSKHSRWSQVYYEFHDLAGQRSEGHSTDESATFFEDMRLPVLYDPQHPSKNLALCERLHFTFQI